MSPDRQGEATASMSCILVCLLVATEALFRTLRKAVTFTCSVCDEENEVKINVTLSSAQYVTVLFFAALRFELQHYT